MVKHKTTVSKSVILNEETSEFKNIEYDIEVLETYTKKLFDTYTDETFKDINYFRSDLTRHLIVLKCMEYFCGHRKLTFEKLIEYIPSNNGSRSHKINCINELCDREILQRVDNLDDKRSTIVQPTAKILKLYAKLHFSYKETLYKFKTTIGVLFLFIFTFDF